MAAARSISAQSPGGQGSKDPRGRGMQSQTGGLLEEEPLLGGCLKDPETTALTVVAPCFVFGRNAAVRRRRTSAPLPRAPSLNPMR